jgi:hypothetical protein
MRAARLSPLILGCCALALLACGGLALATRGPVLEGSPEWVRLAVVWNTLTDHSSGALLSQERLHELVPSMDRAEADLSSLVVRKALPAEVARTFRTVLQDRYQYIEEHCYGHPAQRELTDLEAAEAAARWTVEMQLDLLRRSPAPTSLTSAVSSDPKLQQAVQASLITELSFLWQCRIARDDLVKQQGALIGKDANRGKARREPLEVQWARQQQALVDTYRRHRVRPERVIEQLAPYLVRLTLTPPPPAPANELTPPPLFPF